MADPYDSVSVVSYNANPPADDGSVTEANRLKWSTIKTKLTDMLKTAIEAVDTNIIAAFGKVDGGVTSTAISYQVLEADQGKLVRATASGITITTPDAAGVGAPFVFGFLNDSSGDITLDGSGSQTIDGDASITVPAGSGGRIRTEGSNWFTEGQNSIRTQVKPQGYLTLVSVASSPTTPLPSSDQSAKTSVFYRPDGGTLIPISNGTSLTIREFSELTLTLNSNHVANGIYDVFIFSDSGTITIGTGPVWNTVTAGSGARGTGAGTTELDLLKGLLVNKVSMTARNGATTYSVGAASAIYVGSIFMDASAGQVSCHVSYGQARKWGVWNVYNRRAIVLKAGDATVSWASAPATWRQSRADANNFVHVFAGLPEERGDISFNQVGSVSVGDSTTQVDIGLGLNSTTTPTGTIGSLQLSGDIGGAGTFAGVSQINLMARYEAPPALGINKFNSIEQSTLGTGSATLVGTEVYMLLRAKYQG